MNARREALTFQNLELLSNGTLLVYGAVVIALSDVLALWQPVYGIANVAVNVLWALVWAPRRWRESSLISAITIEAPVSRVFGFLGVDPDVDLSGFPVLMQFAFDIARDVADAKSLPSWVPGDEFLKARQKSGVK